MSDKYFCPMCKAEVDLPDMDDEVSCGELFDMVCHICHEPYLFRVEVYEGDEFATFNTEIYEDDFIIRIKFRDEIAIHIKNESGVALCGDGPNNCLSIELSCFNNSPINCKECRKIYVTCGCIEEEQFTKDAKE